MSAILFFPFIKIQCRVRKTLTSGFSYFMLNHSLVQTKIDLFDCFLEKQTRKMNYL